MSQMAVIINKWTAPPQAGDIQLLSPQIAYQCYGHVLKKKAQHYDYKGHYCNAHVRGYFT